jgi:DNA-binding HxlR family transcriptional regulator
MKRKSQTRKRMRKKSPGSLACDLCPIERSLDAIGDRWSPLIIRDAIGGSKRFSEFQRSLGLARNILAARLRSLVDDGVLKKSLVSEGSIREEYLLTKKGLALVPVLIALAQWDSDHPSDGRDACVMPLGARKRRLFKKLGLPFTDP